VCVLSVPFPYAVSKLLQRRLALDYKLRLNTYIQMSKHIHLLKYTHRMIIYTH